MCPLLQFASIKYELLLLVSRYDMFNRPFFFHLTYLQPDIRQHSFLCMRSLLPPNRSGCTWNPVSTCLQRLLCSTDLFIFNIVIVTRPSLFQFD